MAFVKLHDAIFQSSIIEEQLEVRWVWICMLLSCDKEGNIYGTRAALARRANVSQATFDESLDVLMAPDNSSTSQDEDGRRIIKTGPNLWHCVNYRYYRGLKDPVEERKKTAERVRKHRALKKKGNAGNKNVTKCNDKAEAESIEAEADKTQVGISMEDLEDSMRTWNKTADHLGLPKAMNKTKKRLSAMKARMKEHKLTQVELIDTIVDAVSNSKFLQGKTGRDSWRGATFDWCMRPTNFVKIIEGNYTDTKPVSPDTIQAASDIAEIADSHKKSCVNALKLVNDIIIHRDWTDEVACQLKTLGDVISDAALMPAGEGYREIVEAEDYLLDIVADNFEIDAHTTTERRKLAREKIGLPVLY